MRVVDAHHHLWDLGVRDQDWITGPALAPLRRDFLLADYQPLAGAHGVTASVVVQTVTVAGETPELLALAAGSDLVAGVVGWADLTAPDIADRIAALTELPGGQKLAGLRHQVHTSAKLSGLVTEADWRRWQVTDLRPYAEVALDAFGPARLMFGSDWPVCTVAASYPDVIAAARDLIAELSPAEREAVFSGTATAVYGL
jgi:predicted TIM-barrel fold metal-dependent hydrolase